MRTVSPAKLAFASVAFVAAATLSSCTPGQTAGDSAKAQVGVAYTVGGSTPASGFDCSGLTSWAWAKAGLTIPRTAAAQYNASRRITKAELQPGDLVFYGFSGRVSHVAMYVGGGQIVQAQKAGVPVNVQSVEWWATNRIGFGRISG